MLRFIPEILSRSIIHVVHKWALYSVLENIAMLAFFHVPCTLIFELWGVGNLV